jgi:hypothetical protein
MGWEQLEDTEHQQWLHEYSETLLKRGIKLDIGNEFPSNFLSAGDFDGQQTISVTVSKVAAATEETFGLPVVFFEGLQKGLKLKKTNFQALAESWGRQDTGWIGKKGELYLTDVNFGGQIYKDRVRLRSAKTIEDFEPGADE